MDAANPGRGEQHRRTYGAVYEMALASSFTVLPFVGGLLAGNPDAFRLLALPGGLVLSRIQKIQERGRVWRGSHRRI